MTTAIASRNFSLVGEIAENTYEAGRYTVGGREIDEHLHALQQDVLSLVTDQDKDLSITFEAEVAVEEAMPSAGVAQYIGIPAAPQSRRSGKREEAVYNGKLWESSGTFYLSTPTRKTPLNLSAQMKNKLVKLLDPYVQSRIAAELRVSLVVAEVVDGDN